MERNKNGGPAFPVPNDANVTGQEGMSLRDYLAAKAMAGDWAAQSEDIGCFDVDEEDELLENRAKLYYRMADAMLRERGEQP